MAEITNSSRTSPRPFRQRHGDFWIQAFDESTCVSTAVITYGDVVQFDPNQAGTAFANRIVKSSTMANVPNVISSLFLGVAVSGTGSDGSSATIGQESRKVWVAVALPTTEFVWPSKATGTQYTSSLVGKRCALAYDSTLAMFYADVGNSTAADASIVLTGLANDAGTSNGQLLGKFLSTATARYVSAAF